MTNPNGPMTGRPPTYGTMGMVATPHALASEAGMQMLVAGGSAVDAAIAANAVLCVTYPHMAGLGGDGFWLLHAPGGPIEAINASGPAAAAATIERYREEGHEAIPARGPDSALTVPGAVDGWRSAHERAGRLEWPSLLAPAIRYAREGVPVGRSLHDWAAHDVPILARFERSARIFLPGGGSPAQGDRLVQEDLARSLETIATEGPRRGFYEGMIAREICDDLGSQGSPLSTEDFAAFEAEDASPISTTYRGRRVVTFPPNTQGFALLEILNVIEDFDMVAVGDGTADHFHLMAEAVKLAFADRDAWLTDPTSVDIPIDRLISKDYARERRELISMTEASKMLDVEPGIPFPGHTGASRRVVGGDTVAFSVVDSKGLAVSVIQSIYHDFGSAVVGGDTGILMQNRGSFFELDPDHPNALAPGKRTFHTLMPSMMFDGDRLELAFGTMGGEGQPQTQTAMITRLVDFGYDVQQAIEAPRWLMGRTWGDESRDLSLEGRVDDEVARELELRGQPVRMLSNWDDNMGHAQAIRLHEGGLLEGGADPRGDGAAIGY